MLGSALARLRLSCMLSDPNFCVHISSSWVERSLHAEFQLNGLHGSGSFMVVEAKKTRYN